MSFLDIVVKAKSYLREQGRVSTTALKREFTLDDAALEELIEELVDIQQVATRDGRTVTWRAIDGPRSLGGGKAGGSPPTPSPSRHLAEKIAQSRSSLEGERKQVTVLFADVQGSMDLAERMDPEAWSEIMRKFFAILTEGVERFEGFVDKFTGDGIMALFGAPVAHEDHAQRACYAALHLRDRLRQYSDALRLERGVNFSCRLGLNSGEVVVGTIGDDLRMDYTAQGHTVGLAQRMEQLAPPDGIALSHHTQRAVDGFFALRALGPVQVKGVREPIEVSVLEGIGRHRTRLDTSRARGLSRFVGRDSESASLQSALAHALKSTGRVAAVVGEPGVGKSRLCTEFVERCRADGLAVYEAHCPAHGRSIPYLPLLELLRNLFGITDQDGPREARQKIAGELALLDDAFAEDRALVLEFLGVADPKAPQLQLETAVRQRRLFGFLRRLIQLRAEAEPLVLLIDDLHWIDPGSDLFVAQIVEAVSATRTLLLLNFRPEYGADWMHKSWVLQLPMSPLGEDALAELVRDWVGTAPSVSALPKLIGARSGGNPFFTEEIVLSLLETRRLVGKRGAYELAAPLEALQVPATVQSLLAARIDRIGEREKRVLYSAAVIGKEFTRPLLERVADVSGDELDIAISSLLQAELIHERAIYPVAEYAFKHPLTHEVALEAQLTGPRRARHRATAEGIESLEPERLDERSALLARHWSQAGEPVRAAHWHVRAARWVKRTDFAASRQHWAEVRGLLAPLPESQERTQFLLETYPELINMLDRLGADPAEAQRVYTEGVVIAQSASDRRTEALMETIYAQVRSSQDDFVGMHAHAVRAIELADAVGDLPIGLLARHFHGRAFAWEARWREAIEIFDQIVQLGGGDAAASLEVLGWRPYVEALGIRGACISIRGQPQEAFDIAERLPALIRRAGTGADLSSAASDRYWPCWVAGDARRAKLYTDEALQMAERYGSDRNVVYALMTCGNASMLGGRWEEGVGILERARQRIQATGAGGEWSLFIDGFDSVCLAELGERERALERARRAAKLASNDVARSLGIVRARVLRTVNGTEYLDELEAQIAETMEVLVRRGANGWIPLLLLERAGGHKLRGAKDAMKRDLAEARTRFAAMNATGWDAYAKKIEE